MLKESHAVPAQSEGSRSTSATPSGECSTEDKSEPTSSPTTPRTPSDTPQFSGRADAGAAELEEPRRVLPRGRQDEVKSPGPSGTGYAAGGYSGANEQTESGGSVVGNKLVGSMGSVAPGRFVGSSPPRWTYEGGHVERGAGGCDKVDGFGSDRGSGGEGGGVGNDRRARSPFSGDLR